MTNFSHWALSQAGLIDTAFFKVLIEAISALFRICLLTLCAGWSASPAKTDATTLSHTLVFTLTKAS
jgi:hypothetical protein